MKVSVCGRTDRGEKRPNNEDDLAMVDLSDARELGPPIDAEGVPVGERGILLAVCDGVGGRRAGEIASALALETLSHEMESLADGCPRHTLFRTAVENVNRRVWQEAQTQERLRGMATTLTAAVVCHRRTILAHVGDSRAYFLRGKEVRQLTRDQSFIASMIASGAMTEEEAAHSPHRSLILQAIGREPTVDVALDAVDLENGDVLLLCTDGLSEKVRPEEMAKTLLSSSLSGAVQELIALANARGGEDNITALAARVEE
jgi:serine/threonine protein phosphatase PrpC